MVIETAEGDTHVTVDTSMTALRAGVGGEEDVEQQAPVKAYLKKASMFLTRWGEAKGRVWQNRLKQLIFGGTCLPLDTKYPKSELNRIVPSSTLNERTQNNPHVSSRIQ
jgi:hypothetical protein